MIPIHILLVEDNKADAAFVRRRLEGAARLKCTVDHAEWLMSALTVLRNKPVDLIMLDLSLPDSHGIDTVVAVRREAPNVPIVVLSGQEDLGVATRSMEAGADNFIVKRPEMTSEELEREILYSLERWRRATTAKSLMQKSVENLTIDSTPGSSAPASVTGVISAHANVVDECVSKVRLFLQKNNPGVAEQVDQILHSGGYYIAIQELRSILKLNENARSHRAVKISDRAMEAVREATASATVIDPEAELLDVLGNLGDDDGK